MAKQLITYFSLAYLISWTIWLPLYGHISGLNNLPALSFQHTLGGLGPMIASFITTWLFLKKEGLKNLANSEEEAVQLNKVVPFLLEDELKSKGGIYSKKEDWASYVVTDGLLITGQNPGSSREAAEKLMELLK